VPLRFYTCLAGLTAPIWGTVLVIALGVPAGVAALVAAGLLLNALRIWISMERKGPASERSE